MASIQQSMNQLLGAVAGATTAGTYMYRQSNKYKAGVAEKSARTIEKTLGATEEDLAKMTPAQREAHLKRQELATEKRAEAGTLRPSKKRAEGISASYQQLAEKKGMLEQVEAKERGALAEEAEAQWQAEYDAEQAERIASGELVIGEDGSQTEVTEIQKPAPKPTKEELEQQKAQQAVRDMILQDERLVAVDSRTTEYQNYLYSLRGGIV